MKPASPLPGRILALAIVLAVPASALVASLRSRSVGGEVDASPSRTTPKEEPHRSPIALALSADGRRLLTANQTAGSVSLVDTEANKVLAEVPTGDRPAGVAISPDGSRGLVAHWYGYDVALLSLDGDRLAILGRLEVGPEPRGVTFSRDGKSAYVAVGVSNEVVKLDLDPLRIAGRVAVGREPRGLATSPDGKLLLVGNARSGDLSVVSTESLGVLRTVPVEGNVLRQVAISTDGRYGYVAHMKNRGFAATSNNIDQGWVLGQRLTRIDLTDPKPSYASLALDPRGKAAGDAHGMAVSKDGKYLAVGLGGTHEVMLFRTDLRRLPWRIDGSRDLIPPELLNDDGRFRRVALGGRPTEVAFAPDGKTLYVANYLADAVQVVDADSAGLVRTIDLGRPKAISLTRRGEEIFHDATRSFNQWYSCNTCHSDGHTNGQTFDTFNDGRYDLSSAHEGSHKKTPTLRRVVKTGPWTWHGWQTDLDDAAFESFTKSMQGPKPSDEDLKALVAYLATLDFPRNPYRDPSGKLSPEAERGKAVYSSAKAACNTCHGGPEFTDGKIHTVGLEEPGDRYRGYNPPSLRALYDRDPYLHDGRAKTLREALSGPHSAGAVTNLGELTDAELDDLLAYLKTL
ncbi:Lactonase, 7-bladed beta-propeller [Aquisphaera giovannonii]|uniref:Lactonase, 7-bladed beta-propeller n=1 Tax=Aquisphaera giovannonii TaxID=406548 RepID=A0A5B9WCC2_9BACT|nr:cytochrome D1 domain-containing protein [Aquisphaera giovannonii]QEH37914.1 Lactonase, 7-bladed beta-propeller [Aquisphaera giovannonii]